MAIMTEVPNVFAALDRFMEAKGDQRPCPCCEADMRPGSVDLRGVPRFQGYWCTGCGKMFRDEAS